MFYELVSISANYELFILMPSLRHATFSLLTTWLIPTEGVSENDWHLQRKFYLADTNYILKDVSTFCHPKGGAQMCRKAKFVGSSLVVGKTDATHF